MATVKQGVGSKTARTVTGLATLGNGSYATSEIINNTTSQAPDQFVEISITPGTVSGNKLAVLFGLASIDGTVFQTGANSTDEGVMALIGVLPLASNAVAQTKQFSVAAAFGGVMPPYCRFVVKNDSGATFGSATLSTADVILTVA